MGAHSLGGAFRNKSGFEGWFNTNQSIFDNSYYRNLMNKTLDYKNVPVGDKYQWNSTFDRCTSEYNNNNRCKAKPDIVVRMLLNSDMCSYKDFQADEKGKTDCNYESCSLNPDTAKYIEEFANDEGIFKKAFGTVFVKISEFGYSDSPCFLKSPLNSCNELNNSNWILYRFNLIILLLCLFDWILFK